MTNASAVFSHDNQYILKIGDNGHSVDVIENHKYKVVNNSNMNNTIQKMIVNDCNVYV